MRRAGGTTVADSDDFGDPDTEVITEIVSWSRLRRCSLSVNLRDAGVNESGLLELERVAFRIPFYDSSMTALWQLQDVNQDKAEGRGKDWWGVC